MNRSRWMLAVVLGALAVAWLGPAGCSSILGIEAGILDEGSGTTTTTATGGAGGAGKGGAGGTGGASGCASCPGQDDACTHRTCVDDVCGLAHEPDKTPTGNQTTGDCTVQVCDGKGGTRLDPDASDPFDDGNDCTTDSCDGTTPKNEPAATGAPCTSNGGAVCDSAGNCVGCNTGADCSGGGEICQNHQCVPVACQNGTQDAGETDIDCGGPVCNKCGNGKGCNVGNDCLSGVCNGTTCQAPSCNDGLKNGSETDVDCGGGCPQKCAYQKGCSVDADCIGNKCSGTVCLASCTDTVKNNGESDVDCGGGNCAQCAETKLCTTGTDCALGGCCGGPPTKCNHCCSNTMNSNETGVDCGGPFCPDCPNGQGCSSNADCLSGCCFTLLCSIPMACGSSSSSSSSSASSASSASSSGGPIDGGIGGGS